MKTKIFNYKSTGIKHTEEDGFFEFVVKSKFNEEGNRSLQWCKFDGLSIIVETFEPSIIDFVGITLKDVIETRSGHRWELV